MEWELSKENVQPLRKGRKVEVLNETLRAKEESPAQSKIVDSQRRLMKIRRFVICFSPK